MEAFWGCWRRSMEVAVDFLHDSFALDLAWTESGTVYLDAAYTDLQILRVVLGQAENKIGPDSE
jgi:hypothetical protein